MRLTHVSRMTLPPGRLHSYAPRASARAEARLPVSFDQQRHVAVGDRAGSWMAIAFRADARDRDLLARAWDAVVHRHGTLGTVFESADDLFEADLAPGEWTTHETGHDPRGALRALLDDTCRSLGNPSHLLAVLEPAASESDTRPTVVLASDHAHVDMWSLVVLARDLAETAAAIAAGRMPERPDAPAFVAHTRLLEAAPPAPADVQEAWTRIMTDGGGLMPRFPLPLGDLSTPRAEVVEVRNVLDVPGFDALEAAAGAAGVRVTALALGALVRAHRELADAPLRAVFPVHSRSEQRWHDAVGWFITNSVFECDDAAPRACADAVKRSLALGSYPLAPLLRPWGGMPDTPGMFAISWIDTRRIPIRLPAEADGQWVSAATRTDGVMIWFAAGDDGLHLRCRYPDTLEARASVPAWIDIVEQHLRESAASAPL